MVAYLVLVFQFNLAKRHEPTAALARLIEELCPFSYLCRSKLYLDSAVRQSAFPNILSSLHRHIGPKGLLPRILPVALVQEPIVHRDSISGFSSYKTLSVSSNPRAAIVTLESANITMLSHFSHRDFVASSLIVNSRNYLIGSLYQDISSNEVNFDPSLWASTFNNIVVAGDSNAHSTLWGSAQNNTRGDFWEEFLLLHDFEIANRGTECTFENHLGSSVIDVTLSKNVEVLDWRNTAMQYGSDHCLITFCIEGLLNTSDKCFQNIASTDWKTFTDRLPILPKERITTTSQLEERAGRLINNVREAFDLACPPKKALPMRPCRWWNHTLSILLRKKNLAAREARKYAGSMKGALARSKKIGLGRLFNKYLKKAKADSWQDFISNLKGSKSVAAVFKSVKTKESMIMPMLRKDANSWAATSEENLEILRSSHFKNSTTSFDLNYGSSSDVSHDLPPELDGFFSWEMIKKAIDELPLGKAPGPDGIKNEVLRRLPDPYIEELLEQCKFSIATSFIPTSWLNIKTIYIKKTGKPNQDCPRTYRPIGLSSNFLKICERLVNWRLKQTVLANGIPKQHAFTMNKSTESAISEVVNVLEKAKCNGMVACLLSIDIQGAFDMVPFDSIRDSLIEHGTETQIWKWADYLSRNRVMVSSLAGVTITYRPLEGTTQGGLNGPDFWITFLWNIILIRAMISTNSLKLQ